MIGSATGGDGIGVDPPIVILPNSGMTIRFSSVMGLKSDFTASEEFHTTPNVIVEMAPEDLVRYLPTKDKPGKPDPSWDTVMRECLKLAGVGYP